MNYDELKKILNSCNIDSNDGKNLLLELEKEGFAVARMTSIYKYLEDKKNFYSLTGNGINHPNDFVVRAYAQLLFEMLWQGEK